MSVKKLPTQAAGAALPLRGVRGERHNTSKRRMPTRRVACAFGSLYHFWSKNQATGPTYLGKSLVLSTSNLKRNRSYAIY